MALFKKLKDILFEEEEYTEPIKIREEKKEEVIKKEEEPKVEKVTQVNPPIEKKEENRDVKVTSERELFKSDNTFTFPDFDEEEFQTNISRPKINNNVLEYERKKTVENRNEHGRYEKVEIVEKKKFKPSPIISPVYGILNQDYKAEDIVDKNDKFNIDIDEVRKKAFETPKKAEKEKKEDKTITSTIDEPVVTFFEEKDNIKVEEEPKEENYKTINDLLEEASEEIPLDDTIELPAPNNLDVIEEELEKIEEENKKDDEDTLDNTLDNDLFELIDSMYDDRKEE